MKSFIPFMLILASFKVQAQQTDASQKMEVMVSMMNLRNALLNKDSIALEKLLSNEVQYGHSNGMIETKKVLIHSIMSRTQNYKLIDPSDMDIKIYDNTAVVNTKLKVDMLFNNDPINLTMHALLVWIKKDNNWQLIARQSVKLNEY